MYEKVFDRFKELPVENNMNAGL